MTTELTQKLENIISGHSINEDDADWLRALTQRPAAQAEREAFEAAPKAIDWHAVTLSLDEAHDESLDGRHGVARAMLREVCANIRASLPAPQHATPEPCKPCDGMGYVDGVGDACAECGGQGATPEPPATRAEAESNDWRTRLTVNLLRQGAGLTKKQIRALIDHAVDRIEPDPALFAKATPEPVRLAESVHEDNARVLQSILDELRMILGLKDGECITAAVRSLAATPEPLIRFCPGCGSVGDVPDNFRGCCPDGAKARLIPASLAHHCHDLFTLAIDAAKNAATPEPVGEPVAIIGSGWTFFWAAGDAIADIVKRHGLKIGDKLYTRPAPGVPEGFALVPMTDEPVGEPVARVELMQTGGNAGLATRIVEIDDPLRERLRPGDLLFARPAPCVPDGFVLVPVEPTPQMTTLVEHDMWDKPFVNGADVWSAVLAAAQAKGGE